MSWITRSTYAHGRLGRPTTTTDRRYVSDGIVLAIGLAIVVGLALTGVL